jgi:hypothetical protein
MKGDPCHPCSNIRAGRLNGTLMLEAPDRSPFAPELVMKHRKQPVHRAFSRLIARMVLVGSVISSIAFPVIAQDATGPMPPNAQMRTYGDGWVCDLGYRAAGGECLSLDIPEHAFPTGRSYGTGWACSRGYQEVDGSVCAAVPVPANAFLRPAGYDWQCERGYRQERDACVPLVLPEHSYLTGDSAGIGWACDRGYAAVGGKCVLIAVPDNAYLTNESYGAAWVCERGFVGTGEQCDAIVLPMNAYLDTASYGPGWRCERGYAMLNDACVAIDLPENAHLHRSGNRWSCDRGFQLSEGECILGR